LLLLEGNRWNIFHPTRRCILSLGQDLARRQCPWLATALRCRDHNGDIRIEKCHQSQLAASRTQFSEASCGLQVRLQRLEQFEQRRRAVVSSSLFHALPDLCSHYVPYHVRGVSVIAKYIDST